MTEIRLVEHEEQATAGIRRVVPMRELTEFFGRAFGTTSAALSARGLHPTGPPFGRYYGVPTETIDVGAGYPVGSAIADDDDVVAGTLPAGRIVEAVHVGPYDTLSETYAEMQRFMAENGLTAGPVMWESYLSEPEREPDPATWRTQICWPVA